MASLARRVFSALYSKPLIVVTNTITGVVSISIGDVLQQSLEQGLPGKVWKLNSWTADTIMGDFNYDKQRTKNMMMAGVYFSLFGHYWYTYLDRKFPSYVKNSVKKKLLAEIMAGPTIVAGVFFVIGKLKGQSFNQCMEYMKSNFAIICAVEWLIFIPLQWINFTYVPAKFRYLYVASISIGYDAFLSYVLHRNERYQQRTLDKPQQQ